MAVTYDPTLATDRDWVRFLTADTDTTSALISDEEIDAVLSAESAASPANRYFAAATILGFAQSRAFSASAQHNGLSSKRVGSLSMAWGTDASSAQGWAAKIASLRAEGARLLASAGYHLQVMG